MTSAARSAGLRFAGLFLALGLLGAGCAGRHEDRRTLTVFAAASLADALPPLAERFARETGLPVRFHFGSSLSLANQVVHGAPADLVLSASPDVVARLGDRVISSRVLLSNRLVLAGRTGSATPGPWPAALGGPALRLTIGDPETVPAGRYAREALRHLGYWDAVQARLVPALDVRAALALLKGGNVDLAVVYATDLTGMEGVRELYSFPEDSHPPIAYPAVVLRGPRVSEASDLVDFLSSEPAYREFQKFGFLPPTRGAGPWQGRADRR
ncbi:MAG: molybdate ABC transporter substrate-binding protein [Armatimonadetes bacterium]|nr:molybdate ABC transporter substrate-binding protein [Armatimonadota bacterium]